MTDQNTIERLGRREDTNFLNSLRSIGKDMAVGFSREGWGGRESDKNSDFEPPMGFVSWGGSTCVHNRSHVAALTPSSFMHWDRIYSETNEP